jgi:hypothetical protein
MTCWYRTLNRLLKIWIIAAPQVMPLLFAAHLKIALAFLPLTFSGLENNREWALPALWTIYHVHHGERRFNPG